MSDHKTTHSENPLASVFIKSVSPYRKALSLHPHLYGGELYNRASELIALDRLIGQLKNISGEIQKKSYKNLSPVLEAIKDALNGNPKLSWWNLATISIGSAFSQEDDEEKNIREIEYLTEISGLLTEIIRSYQSTDTKLLLKIRLTALEIDSRLIELEQIPGSTKESKETLDYLSSEFSLLNKELKNLIETPHAQWKNDLEGQLSLIKKANQLMRIIAGLSESSPQAYKLFSKKQHLAELSTQMTELLKKSQLIVTPKKLDFWNAENLNELFALFEFFPAISEHLDFSALVSLFMHCEWLFVNDQSTQKRHPQILSSPFLIQLAIQKDAMFAQDLEKAKAASKSKTQKSLYTDPVIFYTKRLKEENDLYNLSSMIRDQSGESFSGEKQPSQIQKNSLLRMRAFAHTSQPRDLDNVLKSFSAEDTASRYYLLQESILEQFIYWRKHGIF